MGSETQPRMRRRSDIDLGVKFRGFSYQLQAVEAVKGLPYAALFHEQGLGKTKIGIDLALEWLRVDTVDAILFVTKRGLVPNWSEEISSHAHLKARVLDQNRSGNFFALNSDTPFYLTHYEVLRSEERRLSLFLKTRRVAVILDEAQKIKNPDAELTKAALRLAPLFSRRVIMTGTPVANRPYDIWAPIYFLDGGKSLGGDFKSFKDTLDLRNDLWESDALREEFEGALAQLFDRIKPFTVRETKTSAGIELPEKRIANVSVELNPQQRRLYDEIRFGLQASIVSGDEIIVDDAEEILKRLLRLVQVASNPRLIDDSYTEDPGKVATLTRLVESAVGEKSKVIIWTSFVENAKWLKKHFLRFGAVGVHGAMTMDERTAAIAAFKSDPLAQILVATPGAAKEGLTLTVANHAIFYDRSFSLDDYLQAQDRIHRISQKQTCYIWNLIAADTVDEWVDSLLTAKRLAAQLGQSDVTIEDYRRAIDYDFGRMIRDILGSGEKG